MPTGARASWARNSWRSRSGSRSCSRRSRVISRCRRARNFFPGHLHGGGKVAREADDQAQPVLGEAQRQLVERKLRLLLDLLELGEDLVFSLHGCHFYPVVRGGYIKLSLNCCSFPVTPW